MKLVKFFVAAFASVAMLAACESPKEKPGNNGGDVIVQEYVQILCDVTASDWDSVGVWAWVEGGANFTQSGVWPGDQLTETTEHDGKTVYIWNCPKNLLGQSIQFILNDFNGNADGVIEQTEDFTIVVAENLLVALTEMGESGKWLMSGGEIFEKPEQEPEEEPVVVLGDHSWGVIGSFAASDDPQTENVGWELDVQMTIVDGWATATVVLEANDEFKVRSNGSWDDPNPNYGFNATEEMSTFPVDGTQFAASYKGGNLKVAEAGTYEVSFTIDGENEYFKILKK